MTKNTNKRKAEKHENVNTLPDTDEEKRHRKSIRKIFEGYDGPKLEETDFGKPEGREAW